jgi:hypothetical protein
MESKSQSRSERPAAEIGTADLIHLYGEIAGRLALYDTEAMHNRYHEIRGELLNRFSGSVPSEIARDSVPNAEGRGIPYRAEVRYDHETRIVTGTINAEAVAGPKYPDECTAGQNLGPASARSSTAATEPYGYLWFNKHMEYRFTHKDPSGMAGVIGDVTPVYKALPSAIATIKDKGS